MHVIVYMLCQPVLWRQRDKKCKRLEGEKREREKKIEDTKFAIHSTQSHSQQTMSDSEQLCK